MPRTAPPVPGDPACPVPRSPGPPRPFPETLRVPFHGAWARAFPDFLTEPRPARSRSPSQHSDPRVPGVAARLPPSISGPSHGGAD